MDNIYNECRVPQAINWLVDETGSLWSWLLADVDWLGVADIRSTGKSKTKCLPVYTRVVEICVY